MRKARLTRPRLSFIVHYGNAETVTIDGKVYTFQTVLTNVDGHVLIAGTEAASSSIFSTPSMARAARLAQTMPPRRPRTRLSLRPQSRRTRWS
jgi:hypothetical protein